MARVVRELGFEAAWILKPGVGIACQWLSTRPHESCALVQTLVQVLWSFAKPYLGMLVAACADAWPRLDTQGKRAVRGVVGTLRDLDPDRVDADLARVCALDADFSGLAIVAEE